jgi:hypothetical protein
LKWTDIYNLNGSYISEEIDVSSNYNHYFSDVNIDSSNGGGSMRVLSRLSYNGGIDWGEWIDVSYGFPYRFFYDNGFYLENLKMQYMLEFDLGTNIGGASPTFNSIDFSLIGAFNIKNEGDVPLKPEVWLKKINGSGDIKLKNETTGKEMIFGMINNGETIYVDCENEDIVTDLPMTYRYNNHNDVFLELEVGDNLLSGEGDFEMAIKLEFKTIQG